MSRLDAFDITLEYDNKKLGLMLMEQEGRKLYSTSFARALAPQYFVGEASYASLPPEQELALSQIEWHAGYGQRSFVSTKKYMSSDGVDARVRGILMLAPKITETIVSEAGSFNGTPVGFVEFKSSLYLASGQKLYKWNTTDSDWDELWAGASLTITDVIVHGDYIFIALGGTNKYYFMDAVHKADDTTNTVTSADATDQDTLNTLLNEIKGDYNAHRVSTTFHDAADTTNVVDAADASDLDTSKTLANQIKAKFNAHRSQSGVHPYDDMLHEVTSDDATDLATGITLGNEIKADYNAHLLAFEQATPAESLADYFGKNQELLWKCIKPNGVKSATNPSCEANPWGTVSVVGDSSTDITEIIPYAGEIHFGKEDGLWKFDFEGAVIDLMPDFKFVPQSTNFKNMRSWRGLLFLPVAQNSLYEFDGSTPYTIGPSTYSPRDFTYAGRIVAMAADAEWMYVLLNPTGSDTEAILMAVRSETIDGTTDYRWHPLDTIDMNPVTTALISSVQANNRRLWVAGTKSAAGKVYYMILSNYYSCPYEDSNAKFCSSGTLTTSLFSANFPNTNKALFSFMLFSENLSKDHREVTVEYQFEGDTTWETVGVFKESPVETQLFKGGVYGKEMRFRLTMTTDDETLIPRVTGLLVTARLESSGLKVYDFTAKCMDNVPLKDGLGRDENTAKYILNEIDSLRDRGYPFTLYDFITGDEVDVDFVAPTPEVIQLQSEPNGKFENVVHVTALKARTA